MILVPSYLPHGVVEGRSIRYRWDDWDRASYYDWVDEDLADEWSDLVEPAICALTIAASEWIFFKLSRLDKDPLPMQCLEAAWCASIDRRYSEGLEVSPQTWLGPVRGPLMIAMNLLHGSLYLTQEGEEDPDEVLSLMSNLVEHTCGVTESFRTWRTACIARLEKYYIAPDPLDDLYDEQTDKNVIPREAFDPETPFDPGLTARSIDRYLRGVDYLQNPFLRSPEDMREEGFEGSPYTFSG